MVSTTIAEEESDSELSVGELEPQGSRRRGQPRPLEKRCVRIYVCVHECGTVFYKCVQCVFEI